MIGVELVMCFGGDLLEGEPKGVVGLFLFDTFKMSPTLACFFKLPILAVKPNDLELNQILNCTHFFCFKANVNISF